MNQPETVEPYGTLEAISQRASFDTSDVQRMRDLATAFPDIAEVWDVLGDVIQLTHEGEIVATEPVDCYQRAVACDPTYAPAHESLGCYHDLLGEFDDAERHFRAAIKHDGGDSPLIGLARTLEQTGRHAEAIETMDLAKDQSDPALVELRSEIADGLWAMDDEE